MNSGNPEMNALYTKLSGAIIRSMSNSSEVYELLSDMQEKGLITGESVFNLLVSLEELATMMDIAPVEERLSKLEPRPKEETPAPPSKQRIDGEELSEREKEFEDYYRKEFDEIRWIKKARIKL